MAFTCRRPSTARTPSPLVGYQFRPGRLILNLFAGIEVSVQGSALDLRLQAESWIGLSERLFSLR